MSMLACYSKKTISSFFPIDADVLTECQDPLLSDNLYPIDKNTKKFILNWHDTWLLPIQTENAWRV